jgi:hypothetical protein
LTEPITRLRSRPFLPHIAAVKIQVYNLSLPWREYVWRQTCSTHRIPNRIQLHDELFFCGESDVWPESSPHSNQPDMPTPPKWLKLPPLIRIHLKARKSAVTALSLRRRVPAKSLTATLALLLGVNYGPRRLANNLDANFHLWDPGIRRSRGVVWPR